MSDITKSISIDSGIFTSASVTFTGSTDVPSDLAIAQNTPFPAGDITVGQISVSVDTGTVSVLPASLPVGTSVTFELKVSAQSGVGVYGKSGDAITALSLVDPPSLTIPDVAGKRYLLMDFGYTAELSASATQPIGVLGSATFGVDASVAQTFAILHRFDQTRGAFDVMAESFASWRLPRQVAKVGSDLNIKPETWIIVELDGSVSIQLAATLGWEVNFAKDLTVLGVTHNLSAKIDAGLQASFGFDVSGKYILVVAREDASLNVHVILSKQRTNGLTLGLNLNVGVQGSDPQLPADFNDFISATFGVHGLQVLNDLQQWADPDNDLGQKIAGLIGSLNPTALESELVQNVTGIPIATVLADFAKAKGVVAAALAQWAAVPEKFSSFLWTFIGKQTSPSDAADFKTFLTGLADPTPGATATAFTTALQTAIFGNTAQGQFLESIADQGLLALANDVTSSIAATAQKAITSIQTAAGNVLNVLNGNIIQNLQTFIDQKLDLSQISAAVAAADPSKVGAWLQNRLANFLDHTLELSDLKDIQTAITTLNTKIAGYYAKAVTALTNKYSVTFAATYQRTTTDTALMDVVFDLSNDNAAQLFAQVVADSNLTALLTAKTTGVTLNTAMMTHDVNRKSTVDLNMPFFNFNKTSVNDAMTTLTAESLGSGLVLNYQVKGQDTVTMTRASSQLAILASLKVAPGQAPVLDSDGSITYELRQVKAGMRPVDLDAGTRPFLNTYLASQFTSGDAAITKFYGDLDKSLNVATKSPGTLLGDVALSLQLSLPASALSGWFLQRSKSQLNSGQMALSLTLQRVWRRVLPALFFQNLDNYVANPSVAALLVWSCLPIANDITLNSDGTLQLSTGGDAGDFFWDHVDNNLRHAVAGSAPTTTTLRGQLQLIKGQLLEAGSPHANDFDPSNTNGFVTQVLSGVGDDDLGSLLFTESTMIGLKPGLFDHGGGATKALSDINQALADAGTVPIQAMSLLTNAVAQLTNTFNSKISSIYSSVPDDVIGPLLLVEASAALGSAGALPDALLTLYALNQGHTFNLGDFVTGTNPSKDQVAQAQTLVGLNQH